MSDFAPSTNQVVAVLEREAAALAVKLGHTWTGITPGALPGDWVTYCTRCFDWCRFACKGETRVQTRTCRYCGGAVGYIDKLCPNPLRMGPCAT